jgi:hypothetical protein
MVREPLGLSYKTLDSKAFSRLQYAATGGRVEKAWVVAGRAAREK